MKSQGLIRGLLAVGLLSAGTANADLVFYGSHESIAGPPNDDVIYDAADERGTLTCVGCQGQLSNLGSGVTTNDQPDADTAAGWSGTQADLFVLANSGVATETDFVEAVTGLELATGVQTNAGDLGSSFASNAVYILFKIGNTPDYALIYNNTGGYITYSYSQATGGGGGGLSHITTFGGTTVSVPEPHTSLLLGAGLLAMAFTWRRKKAAK
jgi:hypothetical protein